MTHHDPFQVLGISPEAGAEEIRAAYLRKVREFPPDRSPREFETIRDAYDELRDPHRRTRGMLLVDPAKPVASLLDGRVSERRFVGPEPWLAVLREPKP